ncbi:hypothetical protein GCM10027514_14780 [Azotobacter armeniacus]
MKCGQASYRSAMRPSIWINRTDLSLLRPHVSRLELRAIGEVASSKYDPTATVDAYPHSLLLDNNPLNAPS